MISRAIVRVQVLYRGVHLVFTFMESFAPMSAFQMGDRFGVASGFTVNPCCLIRFLQCALSHKNWHQQILRTAVGVWTLV